MDWVSLQQSMPKVERLPHRATKIVNLAKVLNGQHYDHIANDFSQETGGGDDAYIKISERRPAIKSFLCSTVVHDSVSLLFSEGHFPTVNSTDKNTSKSLNAIIKQCKLNEIMIDGATRGSVGSIAIQFKVLRGKPFFEVHNTAFLTPFFDPEDPDTLLRVVERYTVDSETLIAQGYNVSPDRSRYFFQREWNSEEEIWYLPFATDETPVIRRDEVNTIKHGLGFCPLVWIKNLPGGDGVDGACTFEAAIDTSIVIDYLLSMGNRALTFTADPKLVIINPSGEEKPITGGSSNAIVIQDSGARAEFLEISGTASEAVREYVRYLRSVALEAVHGNKTDPDKLSAAQSGRAMEMMNQSLIWLADRLRTSYGEVGLISLLKMACLASKRIKGGIKLGSEFITDLDENDISLLWPRWYASTAEDRQADATTYSALTKSALISKKTALKVLASEYDIEDIEAELEQIFLEEKATDERISRQPDITKVSESIQA
jgi:hypothetical protein